MPSTGPLAMTRASRSVQAHPPHQRTHHEHADDEGGEGVHYRGALGTAAMAVRT
jgi:hypothetical protein